MADKIDGIPGSMGAYDSTKNLEDFNPAALVKSQMVEGQAFAAKDKEAKGYLEKFIRDTGNRLRSDTITAKASKHDYVNADWDAADQLRDIAFKGVYVPNQNPDV